MKSWCISAALELSYDQQQGQAGRAQTGQLKPTSDRRGIPDLSWLAVFFAWTRMVKPYTHRTEIKIYITYRLNIRLTGSIFDPRQKVSLDSSH